MNATLDAVVTPLNMLIEDVQRMVKAVIAGQLDERGDESRHRGPNSRRWYADLTSCPTRSLIRSTKSNVMGALSTGDLTQSINQDYQGEFRVLKDSINDTTAKLASTIAEVNATTETLANATGQISATILSQASSERAAGVEETSARRSSRCRRRSGRILKALPGCQFDVRRWNKEGNRRWPGGSPGD